MHKLAVLANGKIGKNLRQISPSYAIRRKNDHRIRTYVDFSQKSSLHFRDWRTLTQAARQTQTQALEQDLLGGVRLRHAAQADDGAGSTRRALRRQHHVAAADLG